MNLLQELLNLTEEEEQKVDAETDKKPEPKTGNESDDMKQQLQDMFEKADTDGNLQPYVKTEIIQARPAKPDEEIHITFPHTPNKKAIAKKGDMVLRLADNPNAMNILAKKIFDKEYEVAEDEAKPDAEGFVNYRLKGHILAFQYTEHEPLTLKDEKGHTIHVKYGDYLGYPIDDSTTLIQLDKAHFEKYYRLAE